MNRRSFFKRVFMGIGALVLPAGMLKGGETGIELIKCVHQPLHDVDFQTYPGVKVESFCHEFKEDKMISGEFVWKKGIKDIKAGDTIKIHDRHFTVTGESVASAGDRRY